MHVTKIGGVLSIATIVLILSYFLIQFIQLLQGENPTITTSLVTQDLESLGNITASDYNIDIAFAVFPLNGGKPIFLDETYFRIDVIMSTTLTINDKYVYTEKNLNDAVKPCN